MHAYIPNLVLFARAFCINYTSVIYYRQMLFQSVVFDRKLINFRVFCRSRGLTDRDIEKQEKQST